jgi:hypothetical protein
VFDRKEASSIFLFVCSSPIKNVGMEFYQVRERKRMKKLFIVLLAGVFLTACGDDFPEDAGRAGQGSMPVDSTVIRVNQGALGTDMGGSIKKPDSSRRTMMVPPPPPSVQPAPRQDSAR